MAKLILEFNFDEIVDDIDDVTVLELKSIKRKIKDGMTVENCESLAESWGQSDFYFVGVTNAIISAIGDGKITRKDIKSY